MKDSKELMERAKAEHDVCIKRWQDLFKRSPMAQPIYHDWEFHMPPNPKDVKREV